MPVSTAPVSGSPTTRIPESTIAIAFLQELHAPTTPLMQKAVIAWMRAESGNTIRANNPWNMTLRAASETGVPTCGSWKSVSSGLTFAAFCSPQDGARASARLLLAGGNDWRGYGKVVTAARAGNPIGFLTALASSAWDAGRYGTKNGGRNKLIVIYGGIIGTGYDKLIPPGGGGGSSSGPNPPGSPLPNGNTFGVPEGTILTKDIVDKIIANMDAAGIFKINGVSNPITEAMAIDTTRKLLYSQIGQPWNVTTREKTQGDIGAAALQANALGSIAGSIGEVVAAMLDPRKWLLFIGLLAGFGMTAWGTVNLARSAA